MRSTDWHKADIVAALHKANTSCRKLSIENGLAANTVAHALHRPYSKTESIIAKSLGVSAQTIWPSRFNDDGTRKDKRKGSKSNPLVDIQPANKSGLEK